MSVRTRALDDARRRARAMVVEIGTQIRLSRMQAGLPLRAVGPAVGRSASWVSRVERGRVRHVALDEFVVLAAAVGLRLWSTSFPAARAIRDAPQLELLRRFRARIGSSWSWSFEVPIPIPGDQRAADAVMRRGDAVVMVEAFTRLADAQAQLRSVSLKRRDMGVGRVVVVVGGSTVNRRALREAADVLAAQFPVGTRAALGALSDGREPAADAVVVL